MAEVQDPHWDPFGIGEPGSGAATSTPQYSSRRELREATSKVPERRVRDEPRRRESREVDRPSRPATVRKSKRVSIPAKTFATPARRERKNPLSVFVTMLMVGGMFAVAGLPAYATMEQESTIANHTLATQKLDAQSFVVADSAALTAPIRDGYSATSREDLAQMARDALRASQNAAYNSSGARELGDDYPWAYELMDHQGGGLSPLNYYYRECVDFVAWRLNRDAGHTSAPFRWVWSNLTPTGGNGGQWQYAWEAKGWPVSDVPIAGAVAYTGGNHVAYVKEVLDGGFVLLEEYNYVPGAYSQRVIPSSSVASFLYPPS